MHAFTVTLLSYSSRISNRFRCQPIGRHERSKSGSRRNTYVLRSWMYVWVGPSILTRRILRHSSLLVALILRCRHNRGTRTMRMYQRGNVIIFGLFFYVTEEYFFIFGEPVVYFSPSDAVALSWTTEKEDNNTKALQYGVAVDSSVIHSLFDLVELCRGGGLFRCFRCFSSGPDLHGIANLVGVRPLRTTKKRNRILLCSTTRSTM